jgi:hypothetical protein
MGEKRVFSMARTQSIFIHLVLNSTLYMFVSRKVCPAVVEILSRPFSQACGVRPFINANSEGCRGRNTIRPPRLAGFESTLISLKLGFRRNFLSRTDRKFLRNANLNEIRFDPSFIGVHRKVTS